MQLRIYEPPRFFEAFLRGRAFTEAPDITARICGICPVAYQMSAVRAMEDACGVAIDDGPIRDLRRLLYCGEWIESHALHVYLLHAPDFLGYESGIAMAADHREIVERGLRMKKAGNALMAVVGGREIHPINVRVGGFYRAPTRAELRPLVEQLERAREAALETVRWTATLPFPDFEHDHELVALRVDGEYPIDRGRIVSTGGLDIAPREWDDWFVEEHVAHSNALHARIRGRGAYLAGPLARYNLNFDALSAGGARGGARGRRRADVPQPVPEHRRAQRRGALRVRRGAADHRRLRAAGPAGGRGRAARGGRLRGQRGAARPALAPLRDRRRRARSSTRGSCRRPRRTSSRSSTTCARSCSSTSGLPDDELRHRCEQAIRNHDPCISCATHFLTLDVERA